MQLIELSDAHSFLQLATPLLMRNEAENNLLLSSSLTLARNSSGRLPKLSYFVAVRDRAPVVAALNVSDRRFLLSSSDSESAGFMGTELRKRERAIRAVLGPEMVARSFCDAYGAARFGSFANEESLLQFRLFRGRLVLPKAPAPGLWRTAKEKDLRQLLAWARQFVIESRHDEPIEETEEVVRAYLENKQLFVWEDSGLVAMAGYGGLTANGARVNMVFTEPRSRGCGYAASLVSALSRKLLGQGDRKFCFLFVSADNTGAIRVYRKLGYEQFGKFSEFRTTQDRASERRENDPTAIDASH